MKPAQPFSWHPVLTALTIWFVHFMLCWSVAEIWPRQWHANVLAWSATAIALLAVGLHLVRIRARHAAGDILGWHYRLAQGAIAIASVAMLFSAVPTVVFLPAAIGS